MPSGLGVKERDKMFELPRDMDLRDQSSGRARLCCSKTPLCTLVHERKLGLASPALLCLHVIVLTIHTNRIENPFNFQMNEQLVGGRKEDISGHSPRIKFSNNNNSCRAIAFRRPQTPIFMSTFYAH